MKYQLISLCALALVNLSFGQGLSQDVSASKLGKPSTTDPGNVNLPPIGPTGQNTSTTTVAPNVTTVNPSPVPTPNVTTEAPPAPTPTPNSTTTTPPTSTTTPPTKKTTLAPTPTPKPTPTPTPTPTPKPSPTPITTVKPSSTSTALPHTTSAPGPAPDNRKFDGPSFVGGIVLASGLMAIGFVAFKFYKARTELNYHTL